MIGAAWLGAALASLGAFLIGRFKGNQAARLACIDRAAADERAGIWHTQASRNAETIGQLDQEIRAARLCRDQAEAERDELRAKLAQAQAEAGEPDNDHAPVINPNAKNNGGDIDGAEVTS